MGVSNHSYNNPSGDNSRGLVDIPGSDGYNGGLIDMEKGVIIVYKDSIGMSDKEAEELVKQLFDKTPYVKSG
jgi:hypothetical protein